MPSEEDEDNEYLIIINLNNPTEIVKIKNFIPNTCNINLCFIQTHRQIHCL